MFAKNGKIRDDGRMVHDMYLFEVKKPSESKGAWDYYTVKATIPADQAFRPLDQGGKLYLSAGVAELRPDDDAVSFFQRADDALYRAKEGGKGRAIAAESG